MLETNQKVAIIYFLKKRYAERFPFDRITSAEMARELGMSYHVLHNYLTSLNVRGVVNYVNHHGERGWRLSDSTLKEIKINIER